MSDEAKLDPDLEKFAKQLRQSKLEPNNIDRDQLMYDAGWAAALAESKQKTTVHKKTGPTSILLSFAGGIAIAAAAMLMITGQTPTIKSETPAIQVASNVSVPTEVVATKATTEERNRPKDLLAWIADIPPGHSISSGFKTQPTEGLRADKQESETLQQPFQRVRTNVELLRELSPRKQRTSPKNPLWSLLMFSGHSFEIR